MKEIKKKMESAEVSMKETEEKLKKPKASGGEADGEKIKELKNYANAPKSATKFQKFSNSSIMDVYENCITNFPCYWKVLSK